jgi:DNA-binding SARP family transcriptional activator
MQRPGPLIWRRPRLVVAALLVPATLIAFFPGVFYEFCDLDDPINFVDNSDYRGLGWSQLRWAWSSRLLGVYQPVSWILFSLQSALWGIDPRGYRVASMLIHSANAVALYSLTLALLARCAPELLRWREGWPQFLAALPALLFAVHPLRVEAATWVSCQPYLACGFFYLMAIHAYLRAHSVQERPHTGWQMTSFLLFWGALLFKAPAGSLPAVIAILDVYPLRRLGGERGWWRPQARRVFAEKLPFLVLGLAFTRMTAQARDLMHPIPTDSTELSARIAHVCYSIWFYPVKTVWPMGLTVYYGFPREMSLRVPIFFTCAMLTVGVSAVFVVARHRWPGLLTTWLIYLVLLAPTAGLVYFGPVIAADRYSYLPMMSWVPLMAAVLCSLGRRSPQIRTGIIVLGLGTAIGLALLSRAQCRTWSDFEARWRNVVEHSAGADPYPFNNLGVALAIKGKREEGLALFAEALRLAPWHVVSQVNFASTLVNLGKYAQAIQPYRDLLKQIPGSSDVRSDLAYALAKCGRFDEAIAHYSEVVRREPNLALAHHNLGYALAQRGDLHGAVRSLSRAAELDPKRSETRYELGAALAKLGASDRAVIHYSEAIRLRPDFAEAKAGLDSLREKNGAERVRLKPPARNSLGPEHDDE